MMSKPPLAINLFDMRKRTHLFILTLIATIFAACSRSDSKEQIDTTLQHAKAAAFEGDWQRSVELCNSLILSSDTANMSWLDYCQTASIFAGAYDNDCDTEASMAAAARCIAKARQLQPDSTAQYLSSPSISNIAALNTVVLTLDGLSSDRTSFPDHEEDLQTTFNND